MKKALEFVSEEQLELTSADLQGLGLTAEEIAESPEIGAWADDPEIPSGTEYVEALRGRGGSQGEKVR